jgi:hypothetical protein
MKEIIGFIKGYYHSTSKPVLFASISFTALLTWMNYGLDLEPLMVSADYLPFQPILGHLIIYAAAFFFPYVLLILRNNDLPGNPFMALSCLLLAPLVFAVKVGMNSHIPVTFNNEWNEYWNHIIYWPMRLLVMVTLLLVCKFLFFKTDPFFGLRLKRFNAAPYILMLLIMTPLISLASMQHDFLNAYPKIKMVLPLPSQADPGALFKTLFELSYGSDFFSIEIFFRGVLVIGLAKWFGKDAILPMACFYCTIHFGKPLVECISSFFGGMLLGIVSYHTRSIFGGLMVHLGIAWLMEAGGYFGNMMQ